MRIIHLFFLLCFIGHAHGQTTNIRSFLASDTNCPLEEAKPQTEKKVPAQESIIFETVEVSEETLPPPPPPPPKKRNLSAVTEPPRSLLPPLPDRTAFDNAAKKIRKNARKNKLRNEYETAAFTFFLSSNMLWGVKDNEGKVLIAPRFDYVIKTEIPDKFIAKEGGHGTYNFYNLQGEKMLADEYDEIYYNDTKDYIHVRKGNKRGWINSDFSVAVPAVYEFVYSLSEDLFLVRNGAYDGVTDKSGKEVLPLRYHELRLLPTDDGSLRFVSRSEHNQVVLTDKNGEDEVYGIEWKKQATFGQLQAGRYLFYDGRLIDIREKQYLFCGTKREKYKIRPVPDFLAMYYLHKQSETFYFDAKGDIFPGLSANNRLPYNHNRAVIAVRQAEKNEYTRSTYRYGVKDENLNWVIPPDYAEITATPKAYFFIVRAPEGKTGVLDRNGRTLIASEYAVILHNRDKFLAYAAVDTAEFSVIDEQGKELYRQKGKFESIKTENGITIAHRADDRRKAVLNDDYAVIYTGKFHGAAPFGDAAIYVLSYENGNKIYRTTDKAGNPFTLNVDGKLYADFKTLTAVENTPFFFLETTEGSKHLYHTKTAKSFPLSAETGFVKGGFYESMNLLETVSEDRRKTGLITPSGRIVVPLIADNIIRPASLSGMAVGIVKDGVSKVYDKAGNELFSDYDTARHLTENIFAVRKNGKTGAVTLQGKTVLPFAYRNIKNDGRGNLIAVGFFGVTSKFDKTGRRLSK